MRLQLLQLALAEHMISCRPLVVIWLHKGLRNGSKLNHYQSLHR